MIQGECLMKSTRQSRLMQGNSNKVKQKMKKRQAKKIMAYSFLKILRQNLPYDEELKALDLLNSKSKYWFERHWQYAPVETVIRERRNLPSVDWFWKRDHRITQAAKITHIHYGKYAVKLHSNHK